MPKIISVHSFRGGTGKSNTTANLAALFAAQGLRVGVVDTDIQSPGIHILLGLNESRIQHSLNDYLQGNCEIEQTAYDVTANINGDLSGRVFLIPSSIKAGEIARILRDGYDVGLLNSGFHRAIAGLSLDVLMIDTHPGLNEETLLSIAISEKLVIIMRPDHQDYQGTGVTVEVARRLGVPDMLLLVNKMPPVLDAAALQERIAKLYSCEVAAVLPHSDELMTLASGGVFALRYPDHPVTERLKQVTARLMQ
jgi:MinD-like ATPase involved in chromosome partitioning or flagellar assembly